MLSIESIRAQIGALLNGHLLLEEFEDWIASASWNLRQSSVELCHLVGEIELRLAEYSADYLGRSDLMADLKALLLQSDVSQPIQKTFISIVHPTYVIAWPSTDSSSWTLTSASGTVMYATPCWTP